MTETRGKTLQQIKALGAPFHMAEIHVSLRANKASLVLIVPTMNPPYPRSEYTLREKYTDYVQAGTDIAKAAVLAGLLADKARIAVVNVDSMKVQA